jgi:hypothetical protein
MRVSSQSPASDRSAASGAEAELARYASLRLILLGAAVTVLAGGCAPARISERHGAISPETASAPVALPPIISGAQWREAAPLGHTADAVRRNLRAGETLALHDLEVRVLATDRTDDAAGEVDLVRLRLSRRGAVEDISLREGAATRWNGFRIAVVAVYGPGELGAGLTALEVATLSSLPAATAASPHAGGASMRLRVPHRIERITLHHTGSAEPLRPTDDPARVLRNLQAWGARDRNWWDVPYHYLIDLHGRVYEGRDWRFMGETNTAYDPAGHFLISVMGNYELQEPTRAQLEAIAELMAWAMTHFGLGGDAIGGHYHYAGTACPGRHLRRYLEDGTLRRMAEARLGSGI